MIRDPEDCVKQLINIDNLRLLHAATTQCEWEHAGGVLVFADGEPVTEGFGKIRQARDDAAFIAAAHNIWPALLDELERLRTFEHAMHCGEKSIVGLQAENKKLRDALQELLDFSDTLQGRHYARSMHARIDAGTLLNPEAAGKNQTQD